MTRKPLFSFDTGADVGIDAVPLNGVIYIEDSDGSGTPKIIKLNDKTSITGLTTISDLLTTYSAQWGDIISSVQDFNITGNLSLVGLPTSDPLIIGEVWNNSGIMTVSAG